MTLAFCATTRKGKTNISILIFFCYQKLLIYLRCIVKPYIIVPRNSLFHKNYLFFCSLCLLKLLLI